MGKLLYISAFLCIASVLMGKDKEVIAIEPLQEHPAAIKEVLDRKLTLECPAMQEVKWQAQPSIRFNYNQASLVDIINEIAAAKNINVILPQKDPLPTKITFSLDHKLTPDQAWLELDRILGILGYSFLAEKNNQVELVKVTKDGMKREYLPLYINPKIDSLPDSDQVIQTIFFLANLKLSDKGKTDIQQILIGSQGKEGMLTANADLKIVDSQNALVITDKSNNIVSAMKIVLALDTAGIPDAIEVLPLYYTQSQHVQDLFQALLPEAKADSATPVAQKKDETKQGMYFPENTKVVALTRTNAIVVMGTTRAIRIVTDFIIKYIDHPLDSGSSILHIYDLQYLNAQNFAPILANLVVGQSATGQADTTAQAVGPKQYFKNVIIAAEQTKQLFEKQTEISPTQAGTDDAGAPSAQAEGVQQGGNRLIIAAQHNDWIRIEELIKKLDKAQPQVAIEVLVVDLVHNVNKLIGSQLRNPDGANNSLSNSLNFQTAHLSNPVLLPPINNDFSFNSNSGFLGLPADALKANLLSFVNGTNTLDQNLVQVMTPGSTVITLRDPNSSGIWNVWQILNQYTNAILLAQPFITTLDNQQATITLATQRLLTGGAAAESGAVNVKNEYVDAATSIDILPRISISHDNINLNVIINVNEFIENTNSRITRLVQTNANVGNGEILAIGGLIREQDTTTLRETPLISKVPILGWFFKRRETVRQKNNLMVFIAPNIIEPRKEGGASAYSESKLCVVQKDLNGAVNFQSLRDPITRWFFKPDPGYGNRIVDDYRHQRVFDEDAQSEEHRMLASNDAISNRKFVPITEKVVALNTSTGKQRKDAKQQHTLPPTPNKQQEQRDRLRILLAQAEENPLAKHQENQV